jgi:hypothetical protein
MQMFENNEVLNNIETFCVMVVLRHRRTREIGPMQEVDRHSDCDSMIRILFNSGRSGTADSHPRSHWRASLQLHAISVSNDMLPIQAICNWKSRFGRILQQMLAQ